MKKLKQTFNYMRILTLQDDSDYIRAREQSIREMQRRREREIARERQRQRDIERKQKEESLRLQRERERLQ